jgi:ribosomal protein L7Ae-like RNA K-turn-binding protein
MNPQVYGFLGLLRGGKLLIGSSLLEAVGKAKLILLAEDASANTQKAALDKAHYRDIPVLMLPSKAALGQALGFDQISVVGVLDKAAAASSSRTYERSLDR